MSMYSIRPHSSEKVELDLPTTMYSVRPIIGQELSTTLKIEDISREQDRLLKKIDQIFRQLELIEEQRNPRREELVVHLSTKKSSEKILKFLTDHHDRLNVRIFRHSSAISSVLPSLNLSTGKTNNSTCSLALIWTEKENLPSMRHANMIINDEEQIVNLLNNEMNKN